MKFQQCAPVTGCLVKPEGKCVLYSGVFLPNLVVTAGIDLDTILLKIDNLIGAAGDELVTLDTNSVNLSGIGTLLSPLTANVNISALDGNGLQILSDGLYVTSSAADFTNSYFDL